LYDLFTKRKTSKKIHQEAVQPRKNVQADYRSKHSGVIGNIDPTLHNLNRIYGLT